MSIDVKFDLMIGNQVIGSDEMVDSKIAGKILGLSSRTIRDYATKGTISSYKLNQRTTRFLVSDLLLWLSHINNRNA